MMKIDLTSSRKHFFAITAVIAGQRKIITPLPGSRKYGILAVLVLVMPTNDSNIFSLRSESNLSLLGHPQRLHSNPMVKSLYL